MYLPRVCIIKNATISFASLIEYKNQFYLKSEERYFNFIAVRHERNSMVYYFSPHLF
jgi:hypothetical protein